MKIPLWVRIVGRIALPPINYLLIRMRYWPRLVCRAIGCPLHHDIPACRRCHGALYYDFIDSGWMEPAFALYYRIKAKLRIKRCAHCAKRLPWRSKDDFCSVECADTWLPF